MILLIFNISIAWHNSALSGPKPRSLKCSWHGSSARYLWNQPCNFLILTSKWSISCRLKKYPSAIKISSALTAFLFIIVSPLLKFEALNNFCHSNSGSQLSLGWHHSGLGWQFKYQLDISDSLVDKTQLLRLGFIKNIAAVDNDRLGGPHQLL